MGALVEAFGRVQAEECGHAQDARIVAPNRNAARSDAGQLVRPYLCGGGDFIDALASRAPLQQFKSESLARSHNDLERSLKESYVDVRGKNGAKTLTR